jgi:AcrR family transcriptional regulator
MNASRTARERARAELTREIKDEARRQLAADGAGRLSLRAVARQLGLVSSALYRYFPTRDDLLTALIVDAYDALGAAAEAADATQPRDDPRGRWRAVCTSVRAWALAHPHEYALIYGSPVPGYQAPQDTIAPAARVPLCIVGVLRAAWSAGTLETASGPALSPALSPVLAEQTARLAESIAPELPGPVLTRALIAWTQIFGMLSFELFGQLVGSVDPSDEFFAHAVERMADFVGLRPDNQSVSNSAAGRTAQRDPPER